MLAKVFSSGLAGIEAYPVEIEVDVREGFPSYSIAGLADAAVKESHTRVKTAIKNSGFTWPPERLTVNLAPSSIKKEGTAFDLPIALGILCASGQLSPGHLNRFCVLGELSLDGSVRPVKGVLPVCASLKNSGIREILVPAANVSEAAVVSYTRVYPVTSLAQAAHLLSDPAMARPYAVDSDSLLRRNSVYPFDFAEVNGQQAARRAVEVAAAGNHNIIFIGPPGSGKTMIARRIPSILPPLHLEEALAVTSIHSVAGLLSGQGLIGQHPFRAPHHTISYAALVGGGSNPQPGEISLAHNGILFLDELPEFRRDALETLRQPLEEGLIRISRSNRSCVFPSSFLLVCSMNPCPCGYLGDSRRPCHCGTSKVAAYAGKVSGPLLDRIDIHIEMPAVKYKELADPGGGEPSAAIRTRVEQAREIQLARFRDDGINYNSQMGVRLLRKYCGMDEESRNLLKTAMTELALSARAYTKVLRMARTIADLAHSDHIEAAHIAEAVQYRSLDNRRP